MLWEAGRRDLGGDEGLPATLADATTEFAAVREALAGLEM